MSTITKVLIPAAGRGTRFLPLTKSIPKEMLPVGNKPALQVVVEEALNSNIKDAIIIISKDKQAIVDYFKPYPELEKKLEETGKIDRIYSVQKIIDNVSFTYIEQKEMLGLGYAVYLAKDAIGDEFFGIILPDDIILSDEPALGQLTKIAEEHNASVIAVMEVPEEKTSSYGIIEIEKQLHDDLFEIKTMVEKPQPKDAPSHLAITGHYVLSPAVFSSLEKITPGAGGELQLTDAIAHMMEQGHKVLAYKIKGDRYDTGSPAGWVKLIQKIAQQEGWL